MRPGACSAGPTAVGVTEAGVGYGNRATPRSLQRQPVGPASNRILGSLRMPAWSVGVRRKPLTKGVPCASSLSASSRVAR
jgi:hypothetical protein